MPPRFAPLRPASLRGRLKRATASMAACAALSLAAAPHAFAQAPAPAASPISGVQLPGHVPALVNSSALLGPVLGAQTLSLALTLPLRDPLGLGALLHDLYDAASPRHGQFLTPPQFADQFGPTQADYDALTAWAQSKGLTVTGTNPSRTILDVTADAATVQAAFRVHLLRYLDPTGREFYAPDADPTVAQSLAGKLSGVIGLDNAAVARPAGGPVTTGTAAGTGPGGGLSPLDIKAVYNLNTVPLTGSGQTLALFELDGYNQSDITAYESNFHLPNVSVQAVPVDQQNPSAPGANTAEVAGDIEMQIALAPGASKILVYEAPYVNPNSNLQSYGQNTIDVYSRIANDDLAKQISTSWYITESAADPISVSTPKGASPLVIAENNVFEQMMSQGQTIYSASGDYGAYADPADANAMNRNYGVQDPGSQPFVCAVGGTIVNNSGQGGTWAGETTWTGLIYQNGANNQAGSGGGISRYWPIPPFQSQPGVYTSASLGSYNSRTIPDVALSAGNGYSIYFNGGWQVYGGTSFSAPLWAGFTALVNQQRSQSGLKPLGLADAYLYQIGTGTLGSYAQDFHDIVTGDNLFYPAATGYDEATGWGSFNGAGLLSDLSTTPAPATVTQPFYRLINAVPGGYGYLYTTYINEAASPGSGFAYQFVDCHVYGGQNDAPGLASFYRLHDPNNGDHLMTTSASEVSSAEAYGYQLDGTVCYVFPTTSPQPSGTVPLYRAYNTSTGQHFYTKNQAEYGGLSAPPWQPEGVCAYVLF